jgi:hypothetical protein
MFDIQVEGIGLRPTTNHQRSTINDQRNQAAPCTRHAESILKVHTRNRLAFSAKCLRRRNTLPVSAFKILSG